MPRFMVSVAGAAIVVAALTGCSGNNSSMGSSSGAAASSAAASETASAQQNRVLVEGQDQGAVEKVRCSSITDGMRIKIAMGDHGVVVILSNAAPPGVQGVQFSKPITAGGVTLEYVAGKSPGKAEATKQGSSYKITGTATGSAPSSQQVSKSFEIDVTCP